ncbi:DUF3168 domain-containing protein [Thioclava kandeliae]|uniref:DUF3168 domain-containing protein n=1 Tax=Thioclava kandeliae TaxID=3070818 RepID=A0ABV1SFR2_9RHOB
MEEEFWTLLTGSAALTALVPSDRIIWGAQGQGDALPAVILNMVSGKSDITMTGANGFVTATAQVDCYAVEYGAAKEIQRAVEAALNGHRGGRFQGIFLTDSRDGRETDTPDRAYRHSMDFNIRYMR